MPEDIYSHNYIDKSIYIPVLSDGDKIFHYTSAAGLKGICSGEFWATEHHFLNDLSEFQIATEIFCEVLDNRMSNTGLLKEIKRRIREESIRAFTPGKLGEEIAYSGDYIISFSLDEDSILMWSEYSDCMGYCMRFDFQQLLNAFHNKVTFHGKVIYNHTEQLRYMEQTFAEYFLDWPTGFDYLNSWDDLNSLTEEELNDFIPFAAIVHLHGGFLVMDSLR